MDHVFEPGKKHSYRDLLCEAHAMEISHLGYCSSHRKLTEVRDFCEDCSSSSKSDEFFYQNFPFYGDDLRCCSCCGDSLKMKKKNHGLFSPCILIKPNWGDLDYSQKGNLISEGEIDVSQLEEDVIENKEGGEKNSNCSVCGCGCKDSAVHEEEEDDRAEMGVEKDGEFLELVEDLSSCNDQKVIRFGCEKDDELAETAPHHLEFYIDRGDDRRLIPVDLIDFSASDDGNNNILTQVKDEGQEQEDCGNEDVVLDFGSHFENDGKLDEREDWEVVSGERLAEFLSVSFHENKQRIVEVEAIDAVEEDPSMEVQEEEEEKEEVSIDEASQAPAVDAQREDLEELVEGTREAELDLHQGTILD